MFQGVAAGGFWSPALQVQPGGPEMGREPRLQPQVILLFHLSNADAFPCTVCFPWPPWHGLSPCVLPVCYLYIHVYTLPGRLHGGPPPVQFLTCPHLLHPLPPPSHLRLHSQSCSFQLMDLTMSPNNLSWGLNDYEKEIVTRRIAESQTVEN